MAVFAIGSGRADIGGYGGSSPRGITAIAVTPGHLKSGPFRPRGRRGDRVAQRADAGHLDGDHVAGLQVQRRGAPVPYARGGAGENQVTSAQLGELADRGDEPWDREDEQVNGGLLQLLPVDGRGDGLRGDVHLVRRDQVRADGSAAVPGLALHPLVRLVLVVAHGDVVADGVAEHVVQRVRLADPAGRLADDDGKLALVVDLGGRAGDVDRGVRPGQAARELREQHGVVGVAAPGLFDVRLVVQADADDLGGVRHDGPQFRLARGEGVGGAASGGGEDLGRGGRAKLGQPRERHEQVALKLGDDGRAALVVGGRVAHGLKPLRSQFYQSVLSLRTC